MTLNKILLVINIFFLQAYLLRFDIGGYPSNLQEILIILNAMVFLIATPFSRVFLALKKYWIILGFVGLTIFSVLTTPIQSCILGEPSAVINCLDFIRHAKFLFFAIVLSVIFLETLKTEKERYAGLHIMGIGALVFGLFSVVYNLIGYNVAHDLRLLGPLDAAVYLAFYLAPFFIYFAISAFENPKQKSNWIYAILLGALIIATRSMGAIGGSAVVLIFYFFKRSKIFTDKISKIVVTVIALAVLGTIFYTKILPTLTTEYSSLDERGQIWLTSVELLKKPSTLLTGVGFGQFQQQYFDNVASVLSHEPLDYYVLQPHNIFLLFIFQFGLLGLAFLGFIIYKIVAKLWCFEKINLGVLAAFMLLYFFIHGLIDTPFFKNDLLILFLIFGELGVKKK